MKISAIINPISGAGADTHAAEHRVALLARALADRNLAGEIHVTTHAGHARTLADDAVAAGADLLIVWGGDGTVNEAGSALVGTSTALGLIPAGSGNGLAAALGTPFQPIRAAAAALDGPIRTIDSGVFAGRPFFNIAGLGVDARISALFNLRGRGSRGPVPYITLGIREGCRYCAAEYEIELDGDVWPVRALLIAFANGGEYGNGVRLTRHARLDDGVLDVTVVEDRSVLARFWHARHLARGTADKAPRVVVRQIRRAVVRAAEPMEYHVDGEPGVIAEAIEVGIRPRSLRVKG